MNAANPVTDLEVLIRSRYGIIHVDTIEDDRVQSLLRLVADRVTVPFCTWSRSRETPDSAARATSAARAARAPPS